MTTKKQKQNSTKTNIFHLAPQRIYCSLIKPDNKIAPFILLQQVSIEIQLGSAIEDIVIKHTELLMIASWTKCL